MVSGLSEVVDPRGKGWQPEGKPIVHRQEFPEDNAVVSFRETRAAKIVHEKSSGDETDRSLVA